jgi:TolA-binding protein
MKITPKLKKLKTKSKKFLKVQRNRRKLYYLLALLFILALALGWSNSHQQHQQKQYQLTQTLNRLHTLSERLERVSGQKAKTDQQVKKKAQTERELRREINELERKLQAKKAKQSLIARTVKRVNPVATAYAAPNTSGGCGDNQYARYIYQKESGCSTTARNASGCYGIGQACPGSKIAHCGSSYSCQNSYFSSYAISRYGSWAAAYSFHRSHGWW